jgi:hypothetical protein
MDASSSAKAPLWERVAVVVGGSVILWVLLLAALRWFASLYFTTL